MYAFPLALRDLRRPQSPEIVGDEERSRELRREGRREKREKKGKKCDVAQRETPR